MAEAPRRTRVKVCGITRPRDARFAVSCGADALGLVRVSNSARCISLAQGSRVREAMSGFVQCVVLFLDPGEAEVASAIDALQPHWLQFHGRESATFCQQFGVPYIKALGQHEFAARQHDYASAHILLIDSHSPGQLGGTGHRIADQQFPRDSVRPLMLAGGLNPDNIGEAITRFRPWGVDASSGLESEPGIKSERKMAAFFRQVALADCNR